MKRLFQSSVRIEWWRRWGCFSHCDVYAAQEFNKRRMSRPWLETLIKQGMSTPVSWKPQQMVFEERGGTWWNNDPDWWSQTVFNALSLAGRKWEVFQVGAVRVDGSLQWYCEEPWWTRDPIYEFSYVKKHWGRPNGGGHYTYLNVDSGVSANPDPSLIPLIPSPQMRLVFTREL